MLCDDIAIRVSRLAKCYQIYDTPRDRLKQFVIPRLQGLAGWSQKQYFREFQALDDISFVIRKGETVGIIGRNGSGKSTLLQIICGTLTPSRGTVETHGRIAALLELGAGFNPEFTGRENVYMNAGIFGLSRQQIAARFSSMEAFADIGDVIDQPVKTYSTGMAIRLAFAVVAHVDADILVIDEALAVGDVFFTQKCMRFLRAFMKTGTVLFVSHDTGAVQNLCHRAMWLEHGKVLQEGSPKNICESYIESFFERQQGINTDSNLQAVEDQNKPRAPKDQRLKLQSAGDLHNDLEVSEFDFVSASFGKDGARIVSVQLMDAKGAIVSSVVGGEQVTMTVKAAVLEFLGSPIVGFYIKDRLGQTLFGDNTYLSYVNSNTECDSGMILVGKFTFRMPCLPRGAYSVAAAVANGSQDMHTIEHWIHDAIIFQSDNQSVAGGLIGIPMEQVSLHQMTPAANNPQ